MTELPIERLRRYVSRELAIASEKFRSYPWHSSDAYAAWLAQTFYYVSHSTRLLALAAARLPLCETQMHRRFLQHTCEENAHEQLAERDLRALGLELNNFPELPELAAFYQSQYYQIEHIDPMCFFGYILFLEGLATQGATWARKEVQRIHGTKVATFLSVHGEEDEAHLEKAFESLKGLTEEQEKLIRRSFAISSALYLATLSKAALYCGASHDKVA